MKFAISLSLERFSDRMDMREALAHTLDMVRLAEEGGFEIAWAPEHHTIELTIGPNPLNLLTYWGTQTERIRLGTAVVTAPYWHPIKLAGEAALVDIMLNGRLELGIARGAYQYEFDRMARGMQQEKGVAYMKELLPALRGLWEGDYEHRGECYSFPAATAVPKPLQKPTPPIWVAARDPGTFEWAIRSGANIMSTPLSRPNSEIKVLSDRFEETLAKVGDVKRPRFMMLRRACVYENPEDWRVPVDVSINYGRHFENLFKNIGTVNNGFPEPVAYETVSNRTDYEPEAIRDAMLFGTPDEIVEKLQMYKEAGVDLFCYGASFGLPYDVARRSLELFISDVMPHFQD